MKLLKEIPETEVSDVYDQMEKFLMTVQTCTDCCTTNNVLFSFKCFVDTFSQKFIEF